MGKVTKAKVKEVAAIAFEGVKTCAKSFCKGFCIGSGVLLTALLIEAKRKDSHLEWVSNK